MTIDQSINLLASMGRPDWPLPRSNYRHAKHCLAAALFAFTCLAQSDSSKQLPGATISTSIGVVVAPTTVRAHGGELVRDLRIQDFEVFDNDKPQKVTADLQDSPCSLVVVVQRSADMSGILPKVQRIGSALTDLVVGQEGEVAVVGFDDRVQIMQDFTSESDKVSQAMKTLTTRSYSHGVIDAVVESVRMLQSRPRGRRRIVLVISEKWDKGSQGRVREALLQAEFANVTIYSLNVSTAAAEVTSQPLPQPPPPFPTTNYHVPAGAPLTPTTIEQNYYLGNWMPLVGNAFHSVKDIFGDNTIEVFTRFTGGKRYSFDDERSLDAAIQGLSEDLHGQYLLSYAPNNLNKGGFHKIRVVVKHPDVDVQTRPGYWVAGKPE